MEMATATNRKHLHQAQLQMVTETGMVMVMETGMVNRRRLLNLLRWDLMTHKNQRRSNQERKRALHLQFQQPNLALVDRYLPFRECYRSTPYKEVTNLTIQIPINLEPWQW